MNKRELIDWYFQELMQEQEKNSSYSNLNNSLNKLSQYGNKVSNIGNTIQNNINNKTAQKLGSSLSNVGNTISNGTTSAIETLDKPTNYFKGFAGQGLQNAGAKLSAQGLTTLGNGITSAGTALSGASSGAVSGGTTSGLALGGPIGALVTLGAMAAMGTHRKASKKSGQSLLNTTTQMAQGSNMEAEQNLAQTQKNSQNLQNQTVQNLGQGVVTGSAAPIETYDPLNYYQNYLRENGYSDDVVNGVPQGLNYGNKEVADWINQYNAGAGKDNPINIPQTPDEIAAARAGTFNNSPITGEVSQIQTIKDSLINKFANGLGDFAKGYTENKTTPFAPNNIKADSTKSKMQRVGEAFGTTARLAQNPAVQALVAGGLSTALTGNPLYGIGMATKFANQRQKTNLYQEALQNQGTNTDVGAFGTLNNTDFSALMGPQYKDAANKIAMAKLQETQNYHDLMMKYYNDKLEETKRNNQINNQAKIINANANATRAAKTGTKKNENKKSTKPIDSPDWGADLAGFTTIMTDPKYIDKAGIARTRFINKYGVDPMKYIKL